jgi:GT2 family glycosyltransferase
MNLDVSVVVPTYQRPDLLSRCLAALTAQDFDHRRYEIIVADDGPSEETRRAVERWAGVTHGGPRIRYVPVTGNHGPAAARNCGWWRAAGPIIAFTDDDTIADPQWLRAGLAAFEDDVIAVWGKLTMPISARPTDYERDAAALAGGEFVTANCFVRKSALTAAGGFDERFRLAWREDSDLFFRLLQQDGRIVHAGDALVLHPVRPAPWGVSLRQQRKILFDALLYKKHPQLYRRKIRARPPMRYYAIVAALAIAVTAALSGAEGLACAAGALWLLLTGHFCWQRLRHTSRAPSHIAEMLFTSVAIPLLAVFWRLRGAFLFRVPFA